MEINFRPSIKQDKVFQYFDDAESTEILFGGGLNSAKTYMMCALSILKCLQYPGIRIAVARNTISDLKKSVWTSYTEVFQSFGMAIDVDYKYNTITGEITFSNGSVILWVALSYMPSDPLYTRLGGLLITFAILDEAGEIPVAGKEKLQTRCGRWKNQEYGIKPLIIMTCNPMRNFLYSDFYLPKKEGTLLPYRKFINATYKDNPYADEEMMLQSTRSLPHQEISRLLYGNWETGDDPNSIVSMEDIVEMYDHSISLNDDKTRYISADIAFKQDGCVLFVWEGNDVLEIIKVDKDENVLDKIKDVARIYNVQTRNITYDSDGVGQYLSQYLRTAKAIINNGTPMKGENYTNLKTQLYYKLGELIRDGKIKIKTDSFRKELEAELLCVKRKVKTSSDSKMAINSKDDQKKIIGHSPDFSDAMMFKMIYEYSRGVFTRMV